MSNTFGGFFRKGRGKGTPQIRKKYFPQRGGGGTQNSANKQVFWSKNTIFQPFWEVSLNAFNARTPFV